MLLGDFQEEVFKPGHYDKTTLVFYLFSASGKYYYFCCSYYFLLTTFHIDLKNKVVSQIVFLFLVWNDHVSTMYHKKRILISFSVTLA